MAWHFWWLKEYLHTKRKGGDTSIRRTCQSVPHPAADGAGATLSLSLHPCRCLCLFACCVIAKQIKTFRLLEFGFEY